MYPISSIIIHYHYVSNVVSKIIEVDKLVIYPIIFSLYERQYLTHYLDIYLNLP